VTQTGTLGGQRVQGSECGLAGVETAREAEVEPFQAGERVGKEGDVRVGQEEGAGFCTPSTSVRIHVEMG